MFTQTLTVKEVQEILRIGQVAAYSLVRSRAFPVIKIGRNYRIPQDSFIVWMKTTCPSAETRNNAALVDQSCILAGLRNGGYHYGK